ncbi:MAG: hypothetical protein WBM83_02815 [Flavobacteriaceae bacterium]
MMSELVLLRHDLVLPVLVGLGGLWLVFVWSVRATPSRKRVLVKSMVSFLALFALAMIALRPALPQPMDKGVGVLLTNNFSQTRLDSLQKAHKGIALIPYAQNRSLGPVLDSISSLYILGQGVAAYDLWQFNDVKASYLGGPQESGISRLAYRPSHTLGDRLQLDGRYSNPQSDRWLFLQGPGEEGLDSVALKRGSTQTFRLEAPLKVSGNYGYALTEKDSLGNQLHTEPIPVQVGERKFLSILMLNSSPSFETKYLKNFLAENGHQVLVKSQLTRGKYKFEYFNRDRTPVYGMTIKDLAAFDVLLIDASSYRNLSANARRSLQESITEHGLGVFIQPDAAFFRAAKKDDFFDFYSTKVTEIGLDDQGKMSLGSFPYRFKNDFLVEEIELMAPPHLAAYRKLGMGRLGSFTLENTYQLVLDGHTDRYRELWTTLLEALSNRTMPMASWSASDDLAFQDQAFHFTLRTRIEQPLVVNDEGDPIPLLQDVDQPFLWHGKTYPQKTKWQYLKMVQDTTARFDFYVMESTDRQAMVAFNTHEENKRQFQEAQGGEETTMVLQPIALVWFFLIFLFGMGWLWLEPKLYGQDA